MAEAELVPRADLRLLPAAEERAGVSLDTISFYCLPFLLAPPSRFFPSRGGRSRFGPDSRDDGVHPPHFLAKFRAPSIPNGAVFK